MTINTTTKRTGLKPVEIGAGAGAAVITAFATSYLGTAGTLAGAAVASVIGTVSTAVLRDSADRSAERLRQSTIRLRQAQAAGLTPTGSTAAAPADPADSTSAAGLGSTAGPAGTTGLGDVPGPEVGAAPRGSGRPRWVALAAGAVVAFAAALVLITGIESAAGKPLAGLVGNETGGGTTIGRTTGGGPSTDERRPEPTTTPTPTSTPSGEPTGTPSGEPSATEPTAEPTAEPSRSGSTPEPSATTGAPAPTTPAPTQAPSPSADPLTSPGP